jgi:transcriptional regulator with XRE-family HTH domain
MLYNVCASELAYKSKYEVCIIMTTSSNQPPTKRQTRYHAHMPKAPSKPRTDFAERLRALRQQRDMTQADLAEATSYTQRVISYYETDCADPNAEMLIAFAGALQVSVDELLGLEKPRRIEQPKQDPTMRRYAKRIQQLIDLPEKDRRAVLRMLDSLAKTAVPVAMAYACAWSGLASGIAASCIMFGFPLS